MKRGQLRFWWRRFVWCRHENLSFGYASYDPAYGRTDHSVYCYDCGNYWREEGAGPQATVRLGR